MLGTRNRLNKMGAERYLLLFSAKSCLTLCNPMDCSMPGFSVFHRLWKFAQTHAHWVSDVIYLIFCHPLLLLPSIFPSIRVFSNELSLCNMWPKYWSFSFNISPSNEYSGLISFRIDCFDLLAVQGTRVFSSTTIWKQQLFSTQAFFMVQLSHPYKTTGKIRALTRRTSVSKVMSLLFNMLSRLVIAFLPRSKHLLISWLQSSSTVILETNNIKPVTASTFSPSICHEVSYLMQIEDRWHGLWFCSLRLPSKCKERFPSLKMLAEGRRCGLRWRTGPHRNQ